jgi:GST-like protein
MIDLFVANTPNNWKVVIAVKEMGLSHHLRRVNLAAGEQFSPAFLALNPNGKTPVMVDADGGTQPPLTLFESGAILPYLAERSGRFLPVDPTRRWTALAWTIWQVAGVGPMLGQAWHFAHRAGPEPDYARERFAHEARRLWAVLDTRLAASPYLGDEDFSIADMAAFPWVWESRNLPGLDWRDYPNVRRWCVRVGRRPGVRAAAQALRVLDAQASSEIDQQ